MSEVASPSVEQQFNRVVQAITQRLHLLDRLPRVRINAWLKKLKEEATSNATWQRNRNCYARLLLEQLRAGCLEVPFNTMPPEGGLPTLPPYLTYRFISPPKQHAGSMYSGSLDGPDFCSSSAVLAGCGVAGLSRPRSAGDVHSRRAALPTLQQLAHNGLHNSWRVGPAASPNRSGSPASPHTLALQQQHWQDGSPRSVRTAGSFRRGYSNSTGNSPQHHPQQRPRSPGAAGLVDAAAAVAAELEAEREEAARMSNRLRFAEDKIMQQEAELVRLQGAASSARRRIKSATSATLTELLDRYGSAAAAWGGSATASLEQPGSAPAGLADGVYKPVWQLLSGLQSVLDSCDKEEQEWLRAKGAAAAAALQAAYESQGSPSAGTGAGASQWEGGGRDHGQQQQVQKGVSQFASEAAAAAAAEGAVLQHCEQCLLDLQQHAEQLVADMHRTKEYATAAAGGRGPLGAAAVAEGAAKLLRPMLKALRHEAKDASKLRKRLEMAAQATDAAAAAASATAACAAESLLRLQTALLQDHNIDDDESTESGSSSSEDGASEASSTDSRRGRRASHRQLEQQQQVLAVAEQQQQQQGARLQRLQSASQVLMELDKASAKLQLQLKDAQQRLQDMASTATAAAAALSSNGGMGGSSALLQHHDNGLIAAATAGIAASLSAGLRAFHSSAGNLARLIQSLRGGAAAAAAAAGAASDGGRGFSSSGGSSQISSHQQGGDLFHGGSRGGSAGGVSSSGSPGKLPLGRSPSSRLGDATLAGTWGEQAAAGGGVGAVGSPGAGSSPLQTGGTGGGGGSAYDAAAHYLIGAAAAAGAAGHSPPGGLGMHGVAAGAGAASISPRGLTDMPSMGSKAAFAQQLQGAGGAISSAGGTGGHGGGGAVNGDAAADAVHAQLAGLSRQASRLSLKATKIISAGGSDLVSGGGGGGGSSSSSSGGLRVLTGSGSFGGSSLRQREYQSPLLSSSLTGGSPFAATGVLSSPRGTSLTSPRTQPGSFGVAGAPSAVAGGAFSGVAGGAGAFSKAGAGAFTGSSTSSLLLGGAGRSALLGGSISSRPVGIGTASVGLGAAAFTSPLLQGGKFGGLGGVGGGGLGLGGGNSGLLRGSGAAGKLSLSPGSSSSIAAISSRLQAMGTGGR